jgi:hypothetical protein
MITIGLTALAVLVLLVLIWRGGGGRIAIIVAAMCGSLIAIIGTIAGAVFNGLGHAVTAILGAFG